MFYCACAHNTLEYEHFHKRDRQLLILEIAQKDAPSLDNYAIDTFVINGLIKPTLKLVCSPEISSFYMHKRAIAWIISVCTLILIIS